MAGPEASSGTGRRRAGTGEHPRTDRSFVPPTGHAPVLPGAAFLGLARAFPRCRVAPWPVAGVGSWPRRGATRPAARRESSRFWPGCGDGAIDDHEAVVGQPRAGEHPQPLAHRGIVAAECQTSNLRWTAVAIWSVLPAGTGRGMKRSLELGLVDGNLRRDLQHGTIFIKFVGPLVRWAGFRRTRSPDPWTRGQRIQLILMPEQSVLVEKGPDGADEDCRSIRWRRCGRRARPRIVSAAAPPRTGAALRGTERWCPRDCGMNSVASRSGRPYDRVERIAHDQPYRKNGYFCADRRERRRALEDDRALCVRRQLDRHRRSERPA